MKLGLVLSGGGAAGAFEAGVVATVEDAGLRPRSCRARRRAR